MRKAAHLIVLSAAVLTAGGIAAQTTDDAPRPEQRAVESATTAVPVDAEAHAPDRETDRAGLQRRIEALLDRQRQLERRLDDMIDRQREPDPAPEAEANRQPRRPTDTPETGGIRYAERETPPTETRRTYTPGYAAEPARQSRQAETEAQQTTAPTPTNLSIDRSPRYATGRYTQPVRPARTTGPAVHRQSTHHYFHHGIYRPEYRHHTGYHHRYGHLPASRHHRSYHPGFHHRKYDGTHHVRTYHGKTYHRKTYYRKSHHGKYHRGHHVGISVGATTGDVGWRYSTGYHHATHHKSRHSGLSIFIK